MKEIWESYASIWDVHCMFINQVNVEHFDSLNKREAIADWVK